MTVTVDDESDGGNYDGELVEETAEQIIESVNAWRRLYRDAVGEERDRIASELKEFARRVQLVPLKNRASPDWAMLWAHAAAESVDVLCARFPDVHASKWRARVARTASLMMIAEGVELESQAALIVAIERSAELLTTKHESRAALARRLADAAPSAGADLWPGPDAIRGWLSRTRTAIFREALAMKVKSIVRSVANEEDESW